MMIFVTLASLAYFVPLASAHASIFHPSMWGFNVTQQTYPYDNRPVSPLSDMTFDQWWFHGHLDHPPHPNDFFELPAGQTAVTEVACNKGATSFFASSEGGDIRSGDDPCPGSPPSEYHTNGPDDLKGCSLAIAYKSDVTQVQPEDFTVFSVNQTCVFHRFTNFQVPARMPSCPPGGCICAWFWIHSQDSGGEQNYMNGFQCNVTGSTSNVPLAKSQVARRCGADPENGKMQDVPGNCTYGAKQPFYWFQKERNNMFEGTYSPPFYLDLYNFKDGAQDDIFEDSYPGGIPPPSPNSTVVPTPFLGSAASPTAALSSSLISSSLASSLPSSVLSTAPQQSSSASPTSLPSSQSQSSSRSTLTLISTVFVTVDPTPVVSASSSASDSLESLSPPPSVVASSSLSSAPTAFLSDTTIFLNALSSPTPTAVGGAPQKFVQLERVIGASSSSMSSSTASATLSPPSGSAQLKICKRKTPLASNPAKRSILPFTLPGMNSHRRMSRRHSLWHMF